MRARRGARRRPGRHAARAAGLVPWLRLPAQGRYAARTAWRRRRALSRFGVAALLLPVAVGAAAPVVPAPVHTRTDAVLTRALSVTPADSTQPVASVTVLPQHVLEGPRPVSVARRGVPAAALRAYVAAEATMRVADPSCRLRWSLLAGIGEVESRHGRVGVDRLGPMQFLPATWHMVGVDADGDDRRDPRDLDDAALAAAAYLCAGPGDLGTPSGARVAVVAYNRSAGYADAVLALSGAYRRHVDDLPAVATAALPTGGGVTVGVGSPGQGVLVGGSDNVVAETARKKRPTGTAEASRPADGEDALERARADRRGDDRPATRAEPGPEHERPRPTRNGGDASPAPVPRPGPTPTRKPDAKPSPGPATRPTHKPRPRPRPRPNPSPAPGVEASYTGTVLRDTRGVALDTGTEIVRLIGDLASQLVDGQKVTVSGILGAGNTLELTLTSAPVPVP